MPEVVILSHAAWQNYFGGDPSVVGQSVRLGDRPRTVVGILSPTARLTPAGETELDFLAPFAFGAPGWNRGFAGHILAAIGRLKPKATLDQARAEMNAICERQSINYPAFKKNWRALLVPLHEEITGPVRPQLLLLFGATCSCRQSGKGNGAAPHARSQPLVGRPETADRKRASRAGRMRARCALGLVECRGV